MVTLLRGGIEEGLDVANKVIIDCGTVPLIAGLPCLEILTH